jgi:hypothetical protein
MAETSGVIPITPSFPISNNSAKSGIIVGEGDKGFNALIDSFLKNYYNSPYMMGQKNTPKPYASRKTGTIPGKKNSHIPLEGK